MKTKKTMWLIPAFIATVFAATMVQAAPQLQCGDIVAGGPCEVTVNPIASHYYATDTNFPTHKMSLSCSVESGSLGNGIYIYGIKDLFPSLSSPNMILLTANNKNQTQTWNFTSKTDGEGNINLVCANCQNVTVKCVGVPK